MLYLELVGPEGIESSEFGTLRRHPDGFWWFDPKPVPRRLPLEEETQLALSQADLALGRLAGVGRMLRNPRLITRPYAAREAVASARIEGTQATLKDLLEAEAGRVPVASSDVNEIDAHIRALENGLARVATEGLSLQTLANVHGILLRKSRHAEHAGTIRREPVWVGSPTGGPETATFVPPLGDAMRRALEDWEDYLARPPRAPVLVRAAMLHYQFLTIHPFVDGNGRVGRMLVQLLLHGEGRLTAPLLYISAYFADRRREYFDRLQAVRERGEIQHWLQFFLTAVAAQAEDGVERAQRLLDLRERYRRELTGTRSRISEVVELIFENPVITAGQVRLALGVSTQGALNLIRSLEQRGWLARLGSFGRGGATYWVAPEVLQGFSGGLEGDDEETASIG